MEKELVMSTVVVPPIKCQGIKTKLVPIIQDVVSSTTYSRWVEPFMGSGVVGFNVKPKSALFADSNPHLINFYNSIKNGDITPERTRAFLEREGQLLLESEGKYYYTMRDRFNKYSDPLDFLFINRSCFNGMIRFNSSGGFNVPFCKKPQRFAQSYITKITNQVMKIQNIIENMECEFVCESFEKTIMQAEQNDLIYCDPPYIGRHVDYFDSWDEDDEIKLNQLLNNSGAKYILSSWYKNKYRENEYISKLWGDLFLTTQEHFYHVGAKEKNRNSMLEAILTNFPYKDDDFQKKKPIQLKLI
jgi:DNA adenine methylase